MSRTPSREDPLASLLTTWLGGPLGRYARLGRSWWTPLVVLLLVTTATFALGVVQKGPCVAEGYAAQQHTSDFRWRQTERGWDTSVEGWNDRQSAFAQLCYSDVAYLFRERGFAEGNLAYLDTGDYRALEYPVGTATVMQVTAWTTGLFDNGYAIHDSMVFFGLTVVVLFVAALLVVWLMRRMNPGRPYDAMFVAAAPTLALDAFINWDLIAVALTTGALFAWSRSRPVLAGVLIGLGVATKFYPLLLLGPLLVLALRTGQGRVWTSTVVTAIGTWLGVNLPIMLLAPGGWSTFYTSNQARRADLGSIWLVLGLDAQSTTLVNVLSVGTFALACFGVAVLALGAHQRPRLGQLVFLTVAAFLLCNKVYSPQYVLWLLPLVALARPNWRDWALWQAAEVGYWIAVWLHLAGLTAPADGGPDQVYAVAVLIRVAATVYLCGQVVRDILAPERDVVRAGGRVDDPVGGTFDEAPEAPWWRQRFGRMPDGTSGPDISSAAADARQEVAR